MSRIRKKDKVITDITGCYCDKTEENFNKMKETHPNGSYTFERHSKGKSKFFRPYISHNGSLIQGFINMSIEDKRKIKLNKKGQWILCQE